MQVKIPSSNLPKSSVGGKNAAIAVAVLTVPENCTLLFCNTVVSSLAAALRRNSVPVIREGAIMDNIFSVAVLDVPWQLRGQAVEAVKTALKEIELLDRATIATSTADDVWLTIHGIGEGDINFQKAFLRPELFAKTRAAMEQAVIDSTLLKARLRESIQKLNPPAETDPQTDDSAAE